ncbi:type VII secretion integral membrane protein EccD [Nocardiopsis sp. LDBS1602]|uniref:type VII secretion integral membrane protein EccD n=1 Tax=Nocardiopsis sp. LDBS1602 TaxID=3109597 RepID=UPI002DBF7BE6|nr:type VII secretion integral membrane protein EccD [Nocardiopsis sp. LDBS1602]MEC3893475.1 type VII secretion integral membrane protein EccD [Nocardiopsis sp. LDBS1602]
MSDVVAADLCRLVVRAPNASFEIAVPCDLPLAELLPTFLLYAEGETEDLDESGLEHGGWVLQRLGSPPLDESETVETLGLTDGETLYLRERADQMPEIHFDDLVDGVADTLSERSDGWGPVVSRRVLTGAAAVGFLGALALLTLLGPTWLAGSTAAATGLLLLLAAGAAARAFDAPVAGAVTGGSAVLFMAFAGATLPGGDPGNALIGARMLSGASTATGAAVLAIAAVAACLPFFTAIIGTALFTAAAGALLMFWDNAPPQGVAVSAAALVLLLCSFAPALAFRLSGMRLPPLPDGVDQLGEYIDPHPARDVRARAQRADHYLGGLLAVVGVVCAASMTVLAAHPGGLASTAGVCVALILLLQARGLSGLWHRVCLLGAGAYGLVTMAVGGGLVGGDTARMVLFGLLLVAALGLLLAAWSVPGNRPIPHWGRAGELFQSLAAIVLVCLVPANLGLLALLRGIGG